jgi:hypothetical protein
MDINLNQLCVFREVARRGRISSPSCSESSGMTPWY